MSRYVLVMFLVFSLESVAQPLTQDEINDAIGHAQALYYEAQFKESIQLLTRVDEVLRPRTDRMQDKINVKLQLALAYIGLNESAQAKLFLRQLFELDADYILDSQQFSPKVITLAADAKAEQNEVRCNTGRDEARRQLAAQNVAVVNTITSMKPRCGGFEEFEPEAAELLYKSGLESYKRGAFGDALQSFRTAVKFAPKHEMASQYIDLTQSKMQISADRLLLDWRKNFDARDFALAASDYRQLASLRDGSAAEPLNQMRTEYRKVLTALVDSANRACATSDTVTIESVRNQVNTMLPDPAIGADILSQMMTCTKKSCMPMETQLALTRLKTRVDPEIPAAYRTFLRHSPVTVRVRVKIDEKGDVTPGEAQGANKPINDAIRSAVAHWKFTPIMTAEGPRCVDTEFAIVINP